MNFQNLLRTTRLDSGGDCHPAARPFHHLLRAILAWTALWLSAALSSAAPLLTTQPADGLTSTSAALHGLVIPQGNAMVYFEYGITSTYGNRTASQEVAGSLMLSVAHSLVDLTGGATYHVRLVAESGANESQNENC